jgi:outer membrane protein TolC
MAPLDVITAESQLATDKTNLVVAQANQLLQQAKLLNDITKNPMDPSVVNIEIVPTTPITNPEVVENAPLPDLMNEAWQKRPEMTIEQLTLVNDKIEVKATRNSLLPSLSVFAQYQGVGLAGINQSGAVLGATGAIVPEQAGPALLAPQMLSSIIPMPTPGALVPQVLRSIPVPYATTSAGIAPTGVPDALNSMINNSSPTYAGGLTFSMPIRNRSAQADNARAQLSERQTEVIYQEEKNTILLNVRQAQISLAQTRAAVTAAQEATKLAQQTLDSTQKKYQLGSTDAYTVVLRARDLTNAQGVELRDRVNLIEALVQFNQAMGRTLESNNITVAGAVRGKVYRAPNIPGALDADDDPPASQGTWTPGKK